MALQRDLAQWALHTKLVQKRTPISAGVLTPIVIASPMRIGLWINLDFGALAIAEVLLYPDQIGTANPINNMSLRFDYQFNLDHHGPLVTSSWSVECPNAFSVNTLELLYQGE